VAGEDVAPDLHRIKEGHQWKGIVPKSESTVGRGRADAASSTERPSSRETHPRQMRQRENLETARARAIKEILPDLSDHSYSQAATRWYERWRVWATHSVRDGLGSRVGIVHDWTWIAPAAKGIVVLARLRGAGGRCDLERAVGY
jgi:hypothetical protein